MSVALSGLQPLLLHYQVLWRSMCAVLRVVAREGLKHDNPRTQHAKQVLVEEDLNASGRTPLQVSSPRSQSYVGAFM